MRLTCPNCGAEYEVPDEVVPTSGRDVQCSNCGDTWFQYHPDHMPDDLEDDFEDAPVAASPAEPDPVGDRYDDADAYEDAYDEDFDEDYDDGWSGDDMDPDEADEDAPVAPRAETPAPRRRPLAPEVKSILQEEANLESRARHGDPLESQPELGLTAPAATVAVRPAAQSESRISRQKPADPAPEPEKIPLRSTETTVTPAPRRELLPDIEEINSTLRRRGDSMRRSDGRPSRRAKKQEQRGFRSGFMSILILAVVAAVIYLQAPKIATAIPQLAGAMDAYVAAVDKGRLWLDAKAEVLAEKLETMSEEPAPDAGN